MHVGQNCAADTELYVIADGYPVGIRGFNNDIVCDVHLLTYLHAAPAVELDAQSERTRYPSGQPLKKPVFPSRKKGFGRKFSQIVFGLAHSVLAAEFPRSFVAV